MLRSPTASTVRVLCCVAVAATLSACAGGQQSVSATQEARQYASRARRDYVPPGPASDPWGPYVVEAARRFDVPERWIREVIRQESGGRLYQNGQLITSGAGAMGLMQVMPATYDELRARYDLDADPFDPHNNILAGTAYIRELYDIFGAPAFLAAYNAGPGRLDDNLMRGRTLPVETQRYVAAIGPRIAGEYPERRSPAESYAFASADGFAASSRFGRAPDAPAPLSVPVSAPVPESLPDPVQVADAAPRAPTRLAPEPRERPLPAAASVRPVQVAVLPEPPPPPAARAPLPESPRRAPQQFAMVSPPPAPLALPPARPGTVRFGGFHLIPQANAEPAPRLHLGNGVGGGAGAAGSWAIQVGAYGNAGLAHAAAGAARGRAGDVLANARPAVGTVRQGGSTLYRARLTGLSREAATAACQRLVRGRTSCMVVSPDSQS